MHDLYKLKEMLMKELEEYGSKGELSAGTLEIVDKLAHTIKNLCKIIEEYEEAEYSGEGGSYEGSYRGGRSNRGSYRGGSSRGGSYEGSYEGSYARGRMNARRDSMGRYSSERGYSRAGLADELRELMQDAPDERTRQEIQRLADKLEQQ